MQACFRTGIFSQKVTMLMSRFPSSVNAGAPPENDRLGYAGLSRVAMPFVGALGEETKDTSKEGMSVVDVDMELVEEAEKNYKVRADIEGQGWHYTYRHQGGGQVE